ncbi:hypothetical protein T484DRAFT_3631892 [Baffinella frigidus]|nr:hypothetical protein T484DRAFT_3631892 [Cryptophyta sp. CCMP2293]
MEGPSNLPHQHPLRDDPTHTLAERRSALQRLGNLLSPGVLAAPPPPAQHQRTPGTCLPSQAGAGLQESHVHCLRDMDPPNLMKRTASEPEPPPTLPERASGAAPEVRAVQGGCHLYAAMEGPSNLPHQHPLRDDSNPHPRRALETTPLALACASWNGWGACCSPVSIRGRSAGAARPAPAQRQEGHGHLPAWYGIGRTDDALYSGQISSGVVLSTRPRQGRVLCCVPRKEVVPNPVERMPILAGRRTRGSSLLPLLLLVLAPRTGAAASEAALAKGDAKVLHHLADDWMPEGWDDGDPCLWPGVECAVPTGETERRVVSLSVRAVCVLQGHAERACDIPSNVEARTPPTPRRFVMLCHRAACTFIAVGGF